MKHTKYVQILRSEEYGDVYTTRAGAEALVAAGKAMGFKNVTLKDIKARRLHYYHEEDVLRHLAEERLERDFDGRVFAVSVLSWHGTEGLVNIPGLGLLPLYACNIKGAKTWYPETACVSYREGQTVDVQLKVFAGGKVFVCGLTPGTLDTEHWDRIKDKPLAFRCDEDGNAISGLFK